MLSQLNGEPQASGMVSIDFVFTMPIAASHSKKNKKQMLDDKYATGKPDIDNLIKFYMDAANTVLWQDDNCVCKVTASKVWGDSPGTVMHVETIERNNENI
jgi:Holliday junction resolvase RusA-like endonuclease